MKRKIFFTILALVLTVSLVNMAVPTAPASAADLEWSSVPGVDNLKSGFGNILAPAGLDVVDMAIGGTTVYVATNNATSPLYKSNDGGLTFTNLYSTSFFPRGYLIKSIAVAPDDPNFVAFTTNNGTADNAYISSDGGSAWTNLGSPATDAVLTAIDIAPGGSYLAVGGSAFTPNATAELWTLSLLIAQAWTARLSGAVDTAAGQVTTAAVKFSPNYDTDKIITVVTGSATNATFQAFRNESGAHTWNGGITWFTDWGTGIDLGLNLTGGLAAADIALPSAYLGTDKYARLAFIGIGGVVSGGGVVRLSDNYTKNFQTWNAGDEGRIDSVAYDSPSGILLAGKYDSNIVYRALTPLVSSPSFEKLNTEKQPGGDNQTLVAWIGTSAIAVAAGDESAFSVSTDNGEAFNDTSLINTAVSVIDDVAVSADGTKYYLTSHDTHEGSGAYDTSVWYYDGSKFIRVMSRKNQADASSAFMVRSAPENNAAVYVVATGTNNIWVSKDSGTAKWTTALTVYKLTVVKDFVVQSENVSYAIDQTGLTKTTNAGTSWSNKVSPIDAFTPYMITVASNGDVLIGGSDGYVAFSKDGGVTLTRTQPVVPYTSAVYVAADKDYAANNIIYAATATYVKRGTATDTGVWATRSPSSINGPGAIPISHNATGIVADNITGAVYVLTANQTDSALWRSLKLTTAASDTADVWSKITSAGIYNSTPQALKLSANATLWAIATDTVTLDSCSDVVAASSPVLISPVDEYLVKVNPGTGVAYNVVFYWERPSPKVTAMDMQIGADPDFYAVVYQNTFTVSADMVGQIIGPTAQQQAEFMPGTAYYWRVRVSSPVSGPWSSVRSLQIAPPGNLRIIAPAIGAEGISTNPFLVWSEYPGATSYELILAQDPSFSIIDFVYSTNNTVYKVPAEYALQNATTYYWRVRALEPSASSWVMGVFSTAQTPSVPVAGSNVSVDAPNWVPRDFDFIVNIDIRDVQDLDAASYEVEYDPAVLRLDSVTDGEINGAAIPISVWTENVSGKIVVVQNLEGISGVSGSGRLAVLHFHSIGDAGTSGGVLLRNGVLSNTLALEIPSSWYDDWLYISTFLMGDANGDGAVNALDITKVERIIAGLD